MIKPFNTYIQIEPEEHEGFIARENATYDEIGRVVAIDEQLVIPIQVGDRVFFDSWMASKFPNESGGHYWLVPIDNVKAYVPKVPEKPLQGGFSTQVSHTGTN